MINKKSGIQLLDCTLRDGGYYNNWDFNQDLVIKMLKGLNKSGVNIVEMGYRSLADSSFSGLYRYCPESQMSFLKKFKNLEFAVMVDIKEYLDQEGNINFSTLDEKFDDADKSYFSWIRLASYHSNINKINNFASYLKKKNYKLTYNYMGISLLTDEQIEHGLSQLETKNIDVIYFADSFGNFTREKMIHYITLFKKHLPESKLGFHAHDNQGLAYANTITALQEGIDFIDSTMLGMGRGAGNLKTEQLLLGLYGTTQWDNLNPYAVLDSIEQDFLPLQREHQWGWDFSYMLSGIENIHPTYCQNLKSAHQYSIKQVSSILNNIPLENRTSFKGDALINACDNVLQSNHQDKDASHRIPNLAPKKAKTILILARGPQLKTHKEAINAFIKKEAPYCIECNDTGLFEDIKKDIAVLNRVRFNELENPVKNDMVDQVICGFDSIESNKINEKLKSIKTHLQPSTYKVDKDSIYMPSFLVGIFAVSIALLSNPDTIYLAGFDGFEKTKYHPEAKDMNDFWQLITEKMKTENRQIFSLLETRYDLPVKPVYSLL